LKRLQSSDKVTYFEHPHALFARQEPDGSITLEAVAWESIQRVVVRKVQGLPDGMFLDEGES
jgi:hypothetical protein